MTPLVVRSAFTKVNTVFDQRRNKNLIDYKRYLYPIDKTRVNEFGFSGEDEDGPKKVDSSDSESISDSESVKDSGDAKLPSPEEKKDQ